ncbi:MAG TPA: threonine synthase [Chloroflexia bacterium]|nr:threonine synthase [Chloroflexia bacterium]
MSTLLVCPICAQQYPRDEVRYRCRCGETLEVAYAPGDPRRSSASGGLFDARRAARRGPDASGTWRFRELLPPFADGEIVSKPEGNTNLYAVGARAGGGFGRIGAYAGLDILYLKHEGENPTGSFKDRGMTVGVSQARRIGARAVACASTGNTSASLAAYAAQAGLPCFVFIPAGAVALGKLAQTLGYGAIAVQVAGDFDTAMRLVQEVSADLGIYLLNSINPFRIEGQKTIGWELLQDLDWQVPDWLVLPAGNLGNTAALGKALAEAQALGLIARLPRIAAIQASGAAPFYQSYCAGFTAPVVVQAETVATAIKIGNPVSYRRAVAVLRATQGVVAAVDDAEILAAKAVVDAAGIGCEPASAATLAGIRQLVRSGTIPRDATVAGILTGHLLKDPDTTLAALPAGRQPLTAGADRQAVAAALAPYLART